MESDIIKISHLNKSFSEVKAVNDLSFRVKKGELFAFLGVNGAGKSTTISILCGLQKKDSGTVQVNGIETDKAGAQTKRMLGVVFQDSVLDKPLTVKENLKSRAALYGITGNAFDKRLQELVEILDFDEFLNRPVGKLSGGQRRRIDIARALLHRPEILILDEPTTGLDPQTRQLIWNVIEKLQKTENMTVFLTTHYMEEAANAGYVVILDKGSIAAEGTPFELKNDLIVVLTSNAQRTLLDETKDRCLYLYIDYPEYEREVSIVNKRVPLAENNLVDDIVEKTQKIRKLDLSKKPSIRSTVDWVRSLIALNEIPPTREALENTLNVVAKNEEDKERIINEVLNKI